MYATPNSWFPSVFGELIATCHDGDASVSGECRASLRRAMDADPSGPVSPETLRAMLVSGNERLGALIVEDAALHQKSNDDIRNLWTNVFEKCESFCDKTRAHAREDKRRLEVLADKMRGTIPVAKPNFGLEGRFTQAFRGIGPDMDSTCVANLNVCADLIDPHCTDPDLRADIEKYAAALVHGKVCESVAARIVGEELERFVARVDQVTARIMDQVRSNARDFGLSRHAVISSEAIELAKRLQSDMISLRANDKIEGFERDMRHLARFKLDSNAATMRSACRAMFDTISRSTGTDLFQTREPAPDASTYQIPMGKRILEHADADVEEVDQGKAAARAESVGGSRAEHRLRGDEDLAASERHRGDEDADAQVKGDESNGEESKGEESKGEESKGEAEREAESRDVAVGGDDDDAADGQRRSVDDEADETEARLQTRDDGASSDGEAVQEDGGMQAREGGAGEPTTADKSSQADGPTDPPTDDSEPPADGDGAASDEPIATQATDVPKALMRGAPMVSWRRYGGIKRLP